MMFNSKGFIFDLMEKSWLLSRFVNNNYNYYFDFSVIMVRYTL